MSDIELTTNESESSEGTKSCVSKDDFNNWLINKITRQSTMISRSYGEKIIEHLRDIREKGADDPNIRSKYSSSFRFQVKKRNFQLINVVGLGDILCLPLKDKESMKERTKDTLNLDKEKRKKTFIKYRVCNIVFKEVTSLKFLNGSTHTTSVDLYFHSTPDHSHVDISTNLKKSSQDWKSNLSSHAMLGQHRQLIFKEDMFDVIDAAHKNGCKHRGYKGTFVKLSATYCSIPRDVVRKFVSMCTFCQKEHACYVPNNSRKKCNVVKEKSLPKKKEFVMMFMTRCQIDILDMQSTPDSEGNFLFIGHFMDHHTKYNVLFPLKSSGASYVARKLCRYVLGHFGLPQILHSNVGRKYVDELIAWILQFWSTDAQIINGNPRSKKLNSILQQRQRTIISLIETIQSKQIECPNWSLWLPGIQYSLNTNQFEADNPPSYENVFKRRPKVYSYAPSSKEIPREEEIVDHDVMETEPINEVLTVSVTDLMQNANGSLLLTQIKDADASLEEKPGKHPETSLSTSNLISPSSLGSLPITLNEQFTIIGSTLGVDGHTIQIPYVDIDANQLAKDNLTADKFEASDFHSLSDMQTSNGKGLSNIIVTAHPDHNLALNCLNMDVIGDTVV